MSKPAELRDQTDEQLELLLKEVQHNLFRLRLQSETERLEAPSDSPRRQCAEIARVKDFVLRLRQIRAARTSGPGRDGLTATASSSTGPHRRRSFPEFTPVQLKRSTPACEKT